MFIEALYMMEKLQKSIKLLLSLLLVDVYLYRLMRLMYLSKMYV